MIVVRRTYVPRPGRGGALLAKLRAASAAMASAGFPALAIFRTHTGYHGTTVTVQEWDGMLEYEESRARVRRTGAVTAIFDEIYPLLAATHHTEILERVA